MGRNRIPTAIQDAKGAFIKDPQRARPDEPTSDRPLGSPPAYLKLNSEEKKLWKQLAKKLLPGVAFESDELFFADLVRSTLKWINREPMTSAERSYRLNLASRFALTPADRSKVSVGKAKKEGKLAKFMRPATPAAIPGEQKFAN